MDTSSPAARAERRAARRQQRSEIPLTKIPLREVRNPLPALEVISAEGVERIHQASLRLLEETGICVMDEEGLSLFEKAGAKVDHVSQMVKFDRGLLMGWVSKAPAEFTWRARNPEHNVRIGGKRIAFAPNGGMPYAQNLDTGRHRATLKDYEVFCKLGQMCNAIHINAGELVAINDVPSSKRHLRRLLTNFTFTDKPVIEAAHGRIIPQDCLNMAQLVFGDLGGDPIFGGIINVSSPLRYHGRMTGGLIAYARAGQVAIITPFISAGAMGPITIAGALTQQNAEALVGIALTQIVNPGVPVIYGNFTTPTDMKSGAPAFGTPEAAWATIVSAQLARYYKLPFRGSGALTTAKVPDAQASYESLWSMWPVIMAHTNFVLHTAGWLEGGLTASYEKWVMDIENAAMFIHFLQGFEINSDTLALDMIAEVGPGGHHFGTPHTQARFATEFYQSTLADRLGYETWAAAGEWDAAKRANQIWKDMLAQYEPPPLDSNLAQALTEFVEKRERELEGKNLYD
jgi:trimethylamine--corrinoid protein Co-methyltransferase